MTELQGGEIGVSSERGVGSTFAFYVKARTVDDITHDTPIANTINSLRRNSSNAAVTLESRRNSSGKPISRSNTIGARRSPAINDAMKTQILPPIHALDHTKLRVLIVEDNLVNQRVLQKQLKNLGFMTEVANHGGEALDLLKTSKFWTGKEKDGLDLSIILMDLEMPILVSQVSTPFHAVPGLLIFVSANLMALIYFLKFWDYTNIRILLGWPHLCETDSRFGTRWHNCQARSNHCCNSKRSPGTD